MKGGSNMKKIYIDGKTLELSTASIRGRWVQRISNGEWVELKVGEELFGEYVIIVSDRDINNSFEYANLSKFRQKLAGMEDKAKAKEQRQPEIGWIEEMGLVFGEDYIDLMDIREDQREQIIQEMNIQPPSLGQKHYFWFTQRGAITIIPVIGTKKSKEFHRNFVLAVFEKIKKAQSQIDALKEIVEILGNHEERISNTEQENQQMKQQIQQMEENQQQMKQENQQMKEENQQMKEEIQQMKENQQPKQPSRVEKWINKGGRCITLASFLNIYRDNSKIPLDGDYRKQTLIDAIDMNMTYKDENGIYHITDLWVGKMVVRRVADNKNIQYIEIIVPKEDPMIQELIKSLGK